MPNPATKTASNPSLLEDPSPILREVILCSRIVFHVFQEYIATCVLDRCWRIAVFEGDDDFCPTVRGFGQPPTHL